MIDLVRLDFEKNDEKMRKVFQRYNLLGMSHSCFLEEGDEEEIERTIQCRYWYLLRQSVMAYDVKISRTWEF